MIAQSDRLPPTDRAAEHALIGAMLIEPSIVGKVVDEITTPAMFTSVENATVFRAIIEAWGDNQHFDGLTIGSKLEGHANHRALIAHLDHCMSQTPSAAGWDAYARLVRNAYQLRELLRVNHDLSESAYDRTKDPDEAIDAALARLRGLRQRKERVQSWNLTELLADQSIQRKPAVIDGILRECAVGYLVAATKTNKTWGVCALAAAVASGQQWFGHNCEPGRVAVIDGELAKASSRFRYQQVCASMGLNNDHTSRIEGFNMRGRSDGLDEICETIADRGPGYYRLIIVDPLFCFYPNDPNFSENDNAQMRRVADKIIRLGELTQAAIMVVHHAGKGNQSDRTIADTGAGAGSLARGADAWLRLLPHESDGAVVLDGVVRDFSPMAASAWRYNLESYLFDQALDLDPAELATTGRRRKGGDKAEVPAIPTWTAQSLADAVLTDTPKTKAEITELATGPGYGMSANRVAQLLDQIRAQSLADVDGGTGRVKLTFKRKTGGVF